MRCDISNKPVFISTHGLHDNNVIFIDDYFDNCRTPRGI